MILRNLIKGISTKKVSGDLNLRIEGVTYNSQKVRKNDLFVAISGFRQDGHKYISDLLKKGACAIVAEQNGDWEAKAKILVPNSRLSLALLSNKFFNFPSQKLKVIGVTQSARQALHHPGQNPADRDGVEAVHVGVVIQSLCGPLVEDAAEGAHGLVRFVVLLELVPCLLAHRRAGLPAGMLLLGLDGFLVELLQVVVQDELLVDRQTLCLVQVDAGVVEGDDPPAQRGGVHAEGAPRVELGIISVFDGGLDIFGPELLVVLLLEPFVGHLAIAEVLVNESPAEDDGGDAMLLQHLAAEAATTRPGIDEGELPPINGHGPDGPEIGGLCRRADRQHPGVGGVLAAELFIDLVHESVDAAPSPTPDPGQLQRGDPYLDLLPVHTVQVQDGRRGSLADQGHHVQAEIVEDQASPSHGGDEESPPAGGESGEDEPVGSREDRHCQQADADVQTVEFAGEMQPQIHRTVEWAQRIPGDPVESRRGVNEEDLLVNLHGASPSVP